MQTLKNRLPSFPVILPVFAVIAFMVYGWTLVVFSWKLNSWLFFLTVGEILVVLAYSLAAALLESLFVLGVLLLVCLLLPARWLKDVFTTRGTAAVVFGLGSIMLYMYRFSVVGYSYIDVLPLWSLVGLGVVLLVSFLSTRLRWVGRAAAWLSDQTLIFLYLLVPASLISLLVVIYRNVF